MAMGQTEAVPAEPNDTGTSYFDDRSIGQFMNSIPMQRAVEVMLTAQPSINRAILVPPFMRTEGQRHLADVASRAVAAVLRRAVDSLRFREDTATEMTRLYVVGADESRAPGLTTDSILFQGMPRARTAAATGAADEDEDKDGDEEEEGDEDCDDGEDDDGSDEEPIPGDPRRPPFVIGGPRVKMSRAKMEAMVEALGQSDLAKKRDGRQ